MMIRCFLSIGLLLSISALSGVCRAETAVIPVHYWTAAEVLPVVQGMLSATGKVTFTDRIHSLVITDTPESIQQVRLFLEKFDRPPPQVRIRLKFQEKLAFQDRSIEGRGRVSGKDWSISTGGKRQDGIEVRVDDRKEDQQRTSEHVLVTTSGRPAYLLTGMDVPFRQRWIDLCRRHAVCTDTVEYRRIDTGMEILPVIVGDRADIQITPRISRVEPGDPQGVVRFTQASTRLSVPLGQWIEIGATRQAGNEVLDAILESSSGTKTSLLSMSLMVETF
ncbi:MAG: secretin N-terminal domain-containing protein [Pseudomonadota bacterium]|uniref:NolW-like domain-containing protein n=1 Tax=Candidatus Desulfatibia profunda TaxID=2841695 RepID=A0A8J6TMZ3_9BACT|nr:hypothetical protein [Candidatus Desulfatibia profunda]MBL7179836.1 hypothetical protein [Desulfobacterales bacterium]